MTRNDEEERFNEIEEEQHEAELETSAELAGSEGPPVPAGPATAGHPESATDEGPYVSEDGALMGRDFVIPGVDPREHDPYRFHTGRKRDLQQARRHL